MSNPAIQDLFYKATNSINEQLDNPVPIGTPPGHKHWVQHFKSNVEVKLDEALVRAWRHAEQVVAPNCPLSSGVECKRVDRPNSKSYLLGIYYDFNIGADVLFVSFFTA